MKGQFVTGDYDGESKGINGYIRCENGDKKKVLIQGFQPYFYVPADEYIQNDAKILEVKTGYTGIHGEKLKKIIMEKPTDVRDFRNNFKQHYEADIRFIRRFMIDTGISNGVIMNEGVTYYSDIKPYEYIAKPLIGMIDIEVLNELRFPTSDKYPIISVTIHDPKSGFLTVLVAKETKTEKVGDGHKVMYVETEADLIKFVNRYIEVVSPDVLTGWNVGWDLGYLKDRAKISGVSLKLNGTCVFDLYEAFRYMYKRGSNRLKDVVITEKLTDKVVAPGFDTKWYPDHLDKVIEYNKTDVEYCIRINDKFKLIEFYWMMKSLAGMEDMESTMHHGTLVDTLMLRMYYKKYVLSSKPEYDKDEHEEGDQYEGAVVFDPPRGIFENVAVFDMSRYYPSIVIAYHLSPEKQDFVPNLCKRLMAERDKLDRQLKMCAPGSKEYDDLKPRRDSFKYFLNAVYGYFGSKKSRMYQKEIAEKVTEVGRRGLIFLKKKSEEVGQVVLYGDTDSVAIKMSMKSEEMEYYLNKKLEEFCAEEQVEPLLKLKFEKMFKTVLYTGVKKRYAGWVVLEGPKTADYIHITGFEYVRRDSCKATKDIQYSMFEHVLKGTPNVFVDELKKSIDKIRDGEVELDDIAIPKSINKNIGDYKSIQDYVRGSIYSNKYLHGDIHAGDTVKMIYIKSIKGFPKTDVICYLDKSSLPEGIEIDYEKLVDKAIKLKVEDVLEIIGVDADVLFNKGLKHIKSLDEVFG